MKSEIRNIKLVYKYGAFGNPNKFGRWIYGKRPDGKTVACKNQRTDNGGMKIWSYWVSPSCNDQEIDSCETEFSEEEWKEITRLPIERQSKKCNEILGKRLLVEE